MVKFSVIIPVYNVKIYLPQCLSSVLRQTMNDYEIILVDDGSTDGSSQLCDQYSQNDDRIKVIHQENMGLSVARNVGLRAASGCFFLFLDSDDCYEQNDFLDQLWRKANNADIVVFNWKKFPDGKKPSEYLPENYFADMKNEYSNGSSFLRDATARSLYPWYAWIYAYRKEFWIRQGFQFPTGKKYEDVALIYKVLLKAENVVIVKDACYCYRTARPGAITNTVKYQTEIDKLDCVKKNILDIEKLQLPNDLKMQLLNNFSCLYYSAVIESYQIKPKEERKRFWKDLQESDWICQYTREKRQKIVGFIVKLFGIPVAAILLNIRRIVRKH